MTRGVWRDVPPHLIHGEGMDGVEGWDEDKEEEEEQKQEGIDCRWR